MSDITPQPPAPQPAPVTAAAPPPALKPAAPAPAKAPPKKGDGDDRRGFLYFLVGTWFAFAWTVFTATMGLWTLITLRFLMPNVLSEPPNRVKVGPPESFDDGTVVERY